MFPSRLTRSAPILLMPVLVLCCSRAEGPPLSLKVVEEHPAGQYLLHAPEDGYRVMVNPPGFTWTAHSGAASYRFLLYRQGERARPCRALDNLGSTVAALGAPLEPGEYSWLVVYLDSAGKSLGRSGLRKFTVEEGLPELPMPDPAVLEARLKNVRPRIFLLPAEIARIKAAAAEGRLPFWGLCLELAGAALEEPLYPEPAPYRDGEFEVNEWRRIYTPGKRGSAHMVRLALAYRITGEEKYLEGARRWLVHLAGWNPLGITSYNLPQPDGSTGNDEAGMPILWRMSMVFDWLHDKLNPDEKALVLACLQARANQLYTHYLARDFLSNPWSNHDGRALAYFGLAGLACLGELPEAGRWLEYVLRSYLTSYPSWGGDEGGWAQGLNYWSSYILRHTYFLDALPKATGVDLYKKPFFRNNGFFPLYFHPPYARSGAFGDGWQGPPGLNEKLLLQKYALATGNPVFLWHAGKIQVDEEETYSPKSRDGDYNWREWAMEDVAGVLGAVPSGIGPEPPAGLPGTRWLRDIGWVAMHSDLGNAGNDVYAYFKSSRYGSFSHSHADQNSFLLNAYGEPLLIDTGYYPWYGSPHHVLWTRQTRAHNAILVNGRGQGNFSMEASGRVEYCRTSGKLTLVRGEAGAAYNVPLSQSTLDQWRELFTEPLPSMEPAVLLARRTLAFAGSKERPWMAVQDYLETDGPAFFDYLLHAQEEMQLDQGQGTILVKSGQVCLLVHLLADDGISFSQSSEFIPPPGDRYENAPRQWHFSARTAVAPGRARFLALFIPYREGEKPPEVERIRSGEARGFRVGDETVLAWWGEGETGRCEGYGEGRLFLELNEDGARKKHTAE